MADETLATRIYEIRVQGLQDAEVSLQSFIDKIKLADDTVRKMKISLSEATASGDTKSIDDLTAAIQKLEKEIEDLRNKEAALRKEIEALNKAQKDLKSASDDATKSIKTEGDESEKSANKFLTFQQRISILKKSQQEALETGTDVDIPETVKTADEIEREKELFSLDEITKKIQQLIVLENQRNELTKLRPALIDEENIKEQQGIQILKERIAQIRAAIEAKGPSSTTTTFRGQDVEIADLKLLMGEYEVAVRKAEQENLIFRRSVAVIGEGFDEFGNKIQVVKTGFDAVTAKADILNTSVSRLSSGVTSEEWTKLQAVLQRIIPELANFTAEDINAGKASELVAQATFKANAALNEQKVILSGRNTLVGDYSKGIIDAFKQLNLGGILQKEKNDIDIQANQIAARINLLSEQWLAAEAKATGGGVALENELKQLGVQYANLQAKSTNLGQALLTTGGIGTQVTRAIGEGFSGLDRTIRTTLVTYLGFQAALSAVTQVIRIDKQVSDQFADLQRVLGATRGEMDALIASVRELDTRTALPDLFNFALIAARAGVASEDIAGVTQAIDRLHVVAGDSIGNIEEVTTNIVKMINVFEGTGKVTGESVTRIGNALISLESSGVATTQFLVNFTDRLAGVEGISKIGIKSVLGLAAAFEETGATAEVSASAITQILLRINSDIAKYAALAKGITDPLKIAPQDVEAFRQLVRENPGKALIDLAVGLRNNKQYLDQFAEGLGGLSARGVRITSVFGLLGANAEHFTQRIQDASDAIDGSSALLDAYTLKQDTLASTLDKIAKQFQLAFSSPGVINALKNIGDAILLVIRTLTAIPFSFVITSLALATAAWAAWKGQVIASTLAQNINNQSTILGNVARVAQRLGLLGSTAAQTANTVAVNTGRVAVTGFAGATVGATEGIIAMNTALSISPLGIILGVIALAIPLMSALADSTNTLAAATDKLKQASGEANQKYSELKTTFQQQSKAADELIPKYTLLKNTLITLREGSDEYNKTQDELRKVTEEIKKQFPLAADSIEDYGDSTKVATDKVNDFVDAQRNALKVTVTESIAADEKLFQSRQDQVAKLKQTADLALKGNLVIEEFVSGGPQGGGTLRRRKATAQENLTAVQDYNKLLTEQKALMDRINGNIRYINNGFKAEKDLVTDGAEDEKLTLEQWRVRLKETQDAINTIVSTTKGREKYKDELQRLTQLENDIKDTIRRLSGDKDKKVSLSNIRFEKDTLSEIEALRNKELAIENRRFADIQEQQKRLQSVRGQELISIKVIHELTVGEQITHIKKLQEINDQFDIERIDKLKELYSRTLTLEEQSHGVEREKLHSQRIQIEKDIFESENKVAERRVQTNKQIQTIIDADFREETKVEKKALEARIAELETTFEALAETQNIPFVVIAEAQKTLHQQEFIETVKHYNDLIALGKAQGANVEALEEEENKALQDIIKKGLDDNQNIYESYFKDVEKKFDDQLARQNERLNQVRNQILNQNLPEPQRAALLDATDQIENLNAATDEFNKASAIYSQKLIDFNLGTGKVTQAELDTAYAALVTGKRNIQDLIDQVNEGINKYGNLRETLVSRIGNIFSNIFKINIGDDAATAAKKQALVEQLSATIESSFSTAREAMDAYFDAERERIEQSKNAIISRMELEKEQAEAQAQSQTERDSLEREFAAKKRDEERKAFEANKKLQVEQAKINVAIELSNLAVVASAPGPANFLTLGLAGRILYGIQAALALVRYFITVGRIQSAQFTGEFGMLIEKLSKGGIIAKLAHGNLIARLDKDTVTAKLARGSDVPIRGGRIAGEYHEKGGAKFIYNNKLYEAEKEELLVHTSKGVSVIRTRNAPTGRKYRVEGSQEEIASAINVAGGGVNFRPGWKMEKLQTGGFLSEAFPSFQFAQAPANPSGFLNRNNDNTELKRLISDLANQVKVVTKKVDVVNDGLVEVSDQTNQRIDQIKVNVIAHEVVTKDRNIKKANSIGTL